MWNHFKKYLYLRIYIKNKKLYLFTVIYIYISSYSLQLNYYQNQNNSYKMSGKLDIIHITYFIIRTDYINHH